MWLSNSTLRLFVFLFWILSYQQMIGQSSSASDPEVPVTKVDNLIQGRRYKPVYSSIKGSQYLNENWMLGHINLLGNTYKDLPLWYDIFADDLVFLYRQPVSFEFILLNKKQLKYFSLEQRQFVNLIYSSFKDTGLEPGYYEVLFQGAVSFLVKRKMETVERNSVTFFIRKDDRFLIKEGKAIRVRNKKSLLGAAGDLYKKQLKKFIKQEGIHLSSKEDFGWLSAIAYLNTLQTK